MEKNKDDLVDMVKLCGPFITQEDIEDDNEFFMYETVLAYDENKTDEEHLVLIRKALVEFNLDLSESELLDLLKRRGDLERLDLALLNYKKSE